MTIHDVAQHPKFLIALSQECPNSIRILESLHPISRYTCLMHAFDFTEKQEYIEIATYGDCQVFAGPDFAHWLIHHRLLNEIPETCAKRNDLVIYFSDGLFKHVGVLIGNGFVESKWGIGHLYEHGVLEVPDSYGTELRFFRGLSYDIAFCYFRKFAKDNGIIFGD